MSYMCSSFLNSVQFLVWPSAESTMCGVVRVKANKFIPEFSSYQSRSSHYLVSSPCIVQHGANTALGGAKFFRTAGCAVLASSQPRRRGYRAHISVGGLLGAQNKRGAAQ